MNEKLEFDVVNFHDAEIKELIYSYQNQTVSLFLSGYFDQNDKKQNIDAKLFFEKVKFIRITANAPWGESIYLSTAKVEQKSDLDVPSDCKHYKFQLNSGDVFDFVAGGFEFQMN